MQRLVDKCLHRDAPSCPTTGAMVQLINYLKLAEARRINALFGKLKKVKDEKLKEYHKYQQYKARWAEEERLKAELEDRARRRSEASTRHPAAPAQPNARGSSLTKEQRAAHLVQSMPKADLKEAEHKRERKY
ncbi:hypothetical protein VTI74DRAFT_7978 [Chaetomium olivicolor]